MSRLPFKNVDDIMRDAGATRTSDRAVNTLRDVLEDEALRVTAEAIVLMNHSGRKTIKDVDILLALRRLQGV